MNFNVCQSQKETKLNGSLNMYEWGNKNKDKVIGIKELKNGFVRDDYKVGLKTNQFIDKTKNSCKMWSIVCKFYNEKVRTIVVIVTITYVELILHFLTWIVRKVVGNMS